jgi:hypothetical protein
MQNGDYIVLSVVADAMLEDKITDLCPEYPCLYDVHRFVHTFLCEALKRLRLRRIKRRSNISSSDEVSQTLLRKQRRPCFTNLFENMSQHARVFASYCKLIALHARTLGGNVHSCTKLFNMLNIRPRCHAWIIALKTPPHTGTCLRQQSRVKLC